MSDDWQTLNIDRGKALGSEIASLRARYVEHRNALAQLEDTAPNESLEARYADIRSELEEMIARLDELERGAAATPITSLSQKTSTGSHSLPERPAAPPRDAPPVPVRPSPAPLERPGSTSGPQRGPTFASATLRTGPKLAPLPRKDRVQVTTRVLVIALVGVAMITIFAFLLWKPWNNRAESSITQPVTAETFGTAEPTIAEAPTRAPEAVETAAGPSPAPASAKPVATEKPAATKPASPIEIRPLARDYGRVLKGTRVTNQFQIVNRSSSNVTIDVGRSTCRCLWFEYPQSIPPRQSATLVVTVDGARAPRGRLEETVKVSLKNDPSTTVSARVSASIE